MPDFFVSVAIGLIKGLVYTYDVITWPIYFVVCNPRKRLQESTSKKAVFVGSNVDSPLRSIESSSLTTTPIPGCETLDDLFLYAVRNYAPNRCLGTRDFFAEEDEVQPNGKVFKKAILGDYQWINYEDVYTRVSNFGSGLLALGQTPRKNIVFFAETRAEWMIAAQACFKYNYPVVTLYASLGQNAIIHGVNESEVEFIITSNDLVSKFKSILSQMPNVRHVIYMDHGKKPDLQGFPSNVHIHSMTYVEELGSKPENIATPITKPSREDIAVIMYTSGSTGIPKGVLLSHGNLMCGMSGQIARVPALGIHDTYIAYLPLAHVLELTAEISCLCHGVSLGYSSAQTLTDQSTRIKRGSKGDISVLKPTLMAGVPLIMDRLYKNVWEKINGSSPFMKALFTFACDYKLRKYENGYSTPLLDRIIFKKIRNILGGRVRLMLSGGAPLSADSQRFMNICFCCSVGQGYGLTETCGAGTIHQVTDRSTGRVGAPLSCNEIVLKDWLEGGYTVNDTPFPRGEILIGGGNVAMGYYKNPEQTAADFKVINGRRYFCTGDIGQIEEDGCLVVIDRKKDLVKLSAGEYVSLGKVETALKMHPLIDNICIYGDSTKMFTVALVVPNQNQLKSLCNKLGLDTTDMDGICSSKIIEKEMMKAITDEGKKAQLERFEIPQRVMVCHEIWTPDTGLVTDAYKLKRKNIQEKYREDITRMYA